MKIQKWEKLKSGKYKVLLENGEKFITYDDVILKNNLLFHKEIDCNTMIKINNDTLYYDIYNKTIKYISQKMRSQKEIEKYLEKYEENIKNQIIDKLKELKLINDENYIKAYVADRINLNNEGLNKIRQDLINQNIEENDIENELSKIDQNIILENLKKLVLKKIKTNTKYSTYILKQKIINEMLNKGYSLENINLILNENLTQDNSIIMKEYNKLYIKLSKQYEGQDLYYNIKTKLYKKGFNSNEIDEITKKLEN